MPRPAPPGGPRALSFRRRFRLLHLDVAVCGDDSAVAGQLEFLAQDARQPSKPRRRVTYDVESCDDGYRIAEDGDPCDTEPYAGGVVANLFRRVHRHAFAELPRATVIRGATALAGRRRFMIVGTRGCGVSCLATRLLHRGAAVEADQLALLESGQVTAFPRPFYLRDGARALLPELSGRLGGFPSLEGQHGDRLYAYHPDADGFPWRVTTGPVDAIVELQPLHGASTRLVEVPRHEMARTLMSVSVAPGGGGAWIAEVTRLVARADCFRLALGRLEDGAVVLRQALW